MATFEVYGVHPKQYANEIAGGDKELLLKTSQRRLAIKMATTASKIKTWYETTMYSYDEDSETLEHIYFAKGKVKTKMLA